MSLIIIIDYTADVPLSLKTLTNLEWNEQGQTKTFSVAAKVSSQWLQFGVMLDHEPSQLKDWIKECDDSIVWKNVMESWLNKEGTDDYPATWDGFYSLLKYLKLSEAISDLNQALMCHQLLKKKSCYGQL